MKVTTPTINDGPHLLAKNFAAAVERDSGGRIKGEVYPASQLGSIPRQIEGVQFGAIQAAVIPPEFFVGVDERFEVMAAPGLVNSIEHGQRLAADPAVLKLMLGLGANKGLHGVGMFIAQPGSRSISRTPIRHLADFQGKKIRIFASEFQSEAIKRLGATPVAMTLGDVLPALQQGAIDGAIAGITVFSAFHYQDAAKYVTEINQPADLPDARNQPEMVRLAAARSAEDHRPGWRRGVAGDQSGGASICSTRHVKAWMAKGGELISLPADEQAKMMQTLVECRRRRIESETGGSARPMRSWPRGEADAASSPSQ